MNNCAIKLYLNQLKKIINMNSKLRTNLMLQFLLWNLLLILTITTQSTTLARVIQRREINDNNNNNNYNETKTVIEIPAELDKEYHNNTSESSIITTEDVTKVATTDRPEVQTTTSITKTTMTKSTSIHVTPVFVDRTTPSINVITTTAGTETTSTSLSTTTTSTTSAPVTKDSPKFENNVKDINQMNFSDNENVVKETEEVTDKLESYTQTTKTILTESVPTTVSNIDGGNDEAGFTTEEHRFDISE